MNGRPFLMNDHRPLCALAASQAMVVTRGQLAELGIGWNHVRYHLQGERWREVSPGVVLLHCGPVPTASLRWVAVLATGPDAALCAWTALERRGLRGWERSPVHVVVRRVHHPVPLAGVVVHQSRRHGPGDVQRIGTLPAHSIERSAVDAAPWSGNVRSACGLLAAVVQQGLSTPERLRRVVDEAGRIRFRTAMFLALNDIEGGAQALSEIDVALLCREVGLPEPARQRVRRDVNGRRRYLDAEWQLDDGSVVILEIDGIGHMEAERWYDDLLRQAEIVVGEPHRVIRLPATAARLEPQRVQAILSRALGRPLTTGRGAAHLRPVSASQRFTDGTR